MPRRPGFGRRRDGVRGAIPGGMTAPPGTHPPRSPRTRHPASGLRPPTPCPRPPARREPGLSARGEGRRSPAHGRSRRRGGCASGRVVQEGPSGGRSRARCGGAVAPGVSAVCSAGAPRSAVLGRCDQRGQWASPVRCGLRGRWVPRCGATPRDRSASPGGARSSGPVVLFPASRTLEATTQSHVCAVFRHPAYAAGPKQAPSLPQPCPTPPPSALTAAGSRPPALGGRPCPGPGPGRLRHAPLSGPRPGHAEARPRSVQAGARPPRARSNRTQVTSDPGHPGTRSRRTQVRPRPRSPCRGPASSVRAVRASRSAGCAHGSARAPYRPRSACAHGRRRCRTAS